MGRKFTPRPERLRFATRLLACSSYVVLCQAALAQDAAKSTGQVEEVVVSAEKRGNETVQKIPEAIQVLSAKSLEEDHLTNFNDYALQIPGLSSINQGPGQTQTIIRGVSSGRQSYAEPQIRQNTGLYIDDSSVSASVFNPDLDLFDVDHIEVLKGPQGTLYGDGSESGTVRILTKQPEFNEFEGSMQLGVNTIDGGGTGGEAKAMINIPLVDNKLALRATAYDNYDAGWINNVYLSKKDSNSTNKEGGSAILRLQATDDIEVKLSARYQFMDSYGRPAEFASGDVAVAGGSPNYSGVPNLLMGHETPSQFAITGHNQVVNFVDQPFTDDFLLLGGTVNWTFGGYTLTSATTFIDRKFVNVLDDTYREREKLAAVYEGFPSLPSIIAPYYNHETIDDFQEEVRLVSPSGKPLSFIAGAYFESGHTKLDQNLPVAGLDSAGAISGYWPSSIALGTTQPDTLFQGLEKVHSKQEAFFTEWSYAITDGLKATAGVRAYHFDQTADFTYGGLAGALGAGDPLDKTGSTSATGETPKFVVSYQVTQDAMTYASASEGFRLGGIQEPIPTNGPFSCLSSFQAIGLSGEPNSFGSDSLWDYEVGAKTGWFDHRLTVNATAYQIRYKDLITPTQLSCGYLYYANAGKVTSNGLELEVSAKVTPSLSVGLNSSYDDAHLDTSDPSIDAFKGDRVPSVPRWQLNVNASKQFSVTDDLVGYLRGDINYASGSLNGWDRSGLSTTDSEVGLSGYPIATRTIPSYVTGNLSAGLNDGRYEYSLYVHNLWNERIVTAINTDRLVPTTYSVAQPLTVGVTFKVNFY